MDDNPKVVVTGLGAVTPYGVGVEAFWEGCKAGASCVTALEFEDEVGGCRAAGHVDFELSAYLSGVESRRLPRFSQLALIAAREATRHARLDVESLDAGRIGIAFGNGSGALPYTHSALAPVFSGGLSRLDPLTLLKALPDMVVANISLALGIQGPILTCVASCSSSTIAIAQALDLIRSGRADAVIAGGSEAWITPLGIASFSVLRALSTRRCDPAEASCPFDVQRDGFVPSEGAGFLVLETDEHARRRGAKVLVELAGAAVTSDAYHLLAPRQDGASAGRCIRLALEDASIRPDLVDYVNAHGTSTLLNDTAEVNALRLALGEWAERPLVSSTKSMLGHALGAAGVIETVAVVKSIQDGVAHPGINLSRVDPGCQLNHVGNAARTASIKVALKNSFAFGGQNACLVLRRDESEDVTGEQAL